MRMLAAAITQAKSDDPKKFAAVLHGMKFEVFNGGEGIMRADDHQFMQPMYMASFGPIKADQPFDEENTGWGWSIAGKVDSERHRGADHLQNEQAVLTGFNRSVRPDCNPAGRSYLSFHHSPSAGRAPWLNSSSSRR
jgi:hypothetical protein